MSNGSKHLYQSVYSDENLTEAWHKVKTKSSGTAGIDRVSVIQFQRYLFQNLKSLQQDLQERRYRPQPAKLVYIPKDNGDKRPIGILTVRDRIVQRAVLNVIEPVFEAEFDNSSYGFRPGRSVQMALDHLSILVNQGYLWAVKLDIHQCFDSIDLRKLQRVIARRIKDRRLRKLIRSFLTINLLQSTSYVAKQRTRTQGLTQGSPLSPLLANVYLDQFDKKARRKQLHTVRYADDIVILCHTQAETKKALKQARVILASLGLALNSHKTRILHVEEGLSFLGATLEFQTSDDEDGRWVPSFPEPEEEKEVDEVRETPFIATDFEALLEEVNKDHNGHPVHR